MHLLTYVSASVTLNASTTAYKGQEVTLYCSAKDCPSEIIWKKNGVRIRKTGKRLQFSPVTGNDNGDYSCHASFWKTAKSAKMTLTVYCRYHLCI